MRRLLLVPVVALVVAGCGSGGGSSSLGSVTSVKQVTDYMNAHHLPCTGVTSNNQVIGVREEASCTVDGQQATIDVYNSNGQRDTIEKTFASLASGATVNGDKWSITGITDAEAHKIQKVTGGTVQ